MAYSVFVFLQLKFYIDSPQSDYHNYLWKFSHVDDLAISVASQGLATGDTLFYAITLFLTQFFTAHQVYLFIVLLTHLIWNIILVRLGGLDILKLFTVLLVINSPFVADYLYGTIRSSLAHAVFLLSVTIFTNKYTNFTLRITAIGLHFSSTILMALSMLNSATRKFRLQKQVRVILIVISALFLVLVMFQINSYRNVPDRDYGSLFSLFIGISFALSLLLNRNVRMLELNAGITAITFCSIPFGFALDRLLGLSLLLVAFSGPYKSIHYLFYLLIMASYVLRYVW